MFLKLTYEEPAVGDCRTVYVNIDNVQTITQLGGCSRISLTSMLCIRVLEDASWIINQMHFPGQMS
jgi:hypothetical protein